MVTWGYLLALLVAFYAFIGWWGARIATNALPPRDLRRRPSHDQIEAAQALLEIALPATEAQILAAARRFYPRCHGDTFADGTPRHMRIAEFMDAADLLISVNEYDANPPFEARYYLAYWEYRAGLLGRFWGTICPPKILNQLRLEAAADR